MNAFISIIEIEWYVYLIAILIILFLIYLGLVCFSFGFMHSFKKRMDNCLNAIKIDLYQMGDTLLKINDLFKDDIDKEQYKSTIDKMTNINFSELNKDDFFEVFSSLEVIKKQLEAIYIYNIDSTTNPDINLLFSSFKDSSIHYADMTQDYNSNAIGYNYWRNLFFTRWIKKLLKINEIESIK